MAHLAPRRAQATIPEATFPPPCQLMARTPVPPLGLGNTSTFTARSTQGMSYPATSNRFKTIPPKGPLWAFP